MRKVRPTSGGKALVKSIEDVMRASPQSDGMTMGEIAAAVGHDDGWCRARMRRLMQAGKLDVGRSLRLALDGTMRPVPVYRLKS